MLTCNVVHDYCNGRVPDVAGDKTPEALLTRSIPARQAGGQGGGSAHTWQRYRACKGCMPTTQ